MKKTIIAAALALLFGAHSASAFGIFDNLNYQARLGYNIGGTMPMGMPASIRGLDSYKPRPSFTLALDAYKPLTKKWGMMAGFHFQTKAMETDARVKSYSMEMRQGGESLSGLFTGNVVTKTSQLVVTLPLQATFNVSDAVRLKFGPYFSYALNNDFRVTPTMAICARATQPDRRWNSDTTRVSVATTTSQAICATGTSASTSVPTGTSRIASALMPTCSGVCRECSARSSRPLSRPCTPCTLRSV